MKALVASGSLAGGVSDRTARDDPQSDATVPAQAVKAWTTGAAPTAEPSELGPADVLARLRADRGADLLRTVVDAQNVVFDPEQAAELVPLLRRFIDLRLRATDRATLVASAAAIRGYIAHLPAAHLDGLADLLARTDVPSALENETVKMVGRKLAAVPPGRDEPHPRLAEQLAGMARDYVAPKLIDRECYGSAALHAVLALALLRTHHWKPAVGRLRQLPDAGFRRQAGRRARAVLAAPPPGGLPDRVANDLDELAGLAG